ncbi:MAG: hypothetical protein ACRDT6_00070 [Micromonosporaceae bacterium]
MSLFLANIWDELISELGLAQLEDTFDAVHGNWLAPPRGASAPRRGDHVLLAPSTMESAVTPRVAAERASALLGWVLFPDQAIGWDFAHQRYRYQPHSVLADTLDLAAAVYVNSDYTRTRLGLAGIRDDLRVLPLGVDYAGISEAAGTAAGHSSEGNGPHIFWGHMWRTQKDPENAIGILTAVLDEVAEVRVTVGRASSWGDPEHSPSDFQDRLTDLVDVLVARGDRRVRVIDRFAKPRAYWRFLGGVDIAFSCSREESFGVGMMEHAAAGVACVLPNDKCYPEIHQGALLVKPEPQHIASGITTLARHAELRHRVQAACTANAERYTAKRTVELICDAFGGAAPRPRPRSRALRRS